MNIGGRIIQRLDELKWERRDLLDRVPDLTAQALYNLIKRDSVRSEWDERIADALGVSVLWLVYGKEVLYPKGATVTTIGAAEEPTKILNFHPPEKFHPAVEETIRLMSETDELGKGMILREARNIAKERDMVKNKPQSLT